MAEDLFRQLLNRLSVSSSAVEGSTGDIEVHGGSEASSKHRCMSNALSAVWTFGSFSDQFRAAVSPHPPKSGPPRFGDHFGVLAKEVVPHSLARSRVSRGTG